MSVSTMHELIAKIGIGASADGTPNTEAAWKEIEARCKVKSRAHHEASHYDRRGRTCLHAACAKKPPLFAIRALLDALKATEDSAILEKRDKHGRTPLLIAIADNADLAVISFLLQECPKAATVSDHSGFLPLMLACCDAAGYTDDGQTQLELVQMLLQSFPQAAQRESSDGRLALHMAVEGQAPAAVVSQLVQGMLVCYISYLDLFFACLMID